jgi:hypothetical protein
MLKVFIINVIEKNSALKDYALKLILMILKFRTSFRLVYELLLISLSFVIPSMINALL